MSFIIGKMPNKIAYKFLLRRPLDLFSALLLPNTYVAQTEIADTIFFAFANQKTRYNWKY